MQDGQFSNTPFETLLSKSKIGGLASLQQQVDPETALKNQKIELDNSIRSRIDATLSIPSNPVVPNIISPFDIDISGRFSKQLLGWDNEDLYAQNQTWGSKALNGTLKGLALAGTTFLQGTVGTIIGLGNLLVGNGANSFYNNDFSNGIQEFNQKTENWLPNYYTKEERDAPWYSPKSFFTANFLFDAFIKNLGFSIGAIYSGAAITKALKLVPAINNLFTGGKAVEAITAIESRLSTVPALERTAAMANIIKATSDKAIQAVKFGNYTERALVSTLGAATEGGIEALQGVNEHRTNLINEYTNTYGAAPTGEALKKINDNAENLGDARFLMNMVLLTATNYIMLPKILSSSYKSSKALANLEINNIAKNAEGQFVTAFSQLPKPVRLASKALNAGGLGFSLTEGFEELSQYAVQLGVQDYYNKAYRGEGKDWVDSISQGWYDARNSNEGMKQFLIGGLSGGLQQSGLISKEGFAKSGKLAERGVFGQGGERGKNTASFLSDINDPKNQATFKSESWLKDMQAAAARGINLQQEGESLIRQGDVLEAKDNEMDYMHNYLSVRIKHGRYDLVKDDIAQMQQQGSTQDGLDKLKQDGKANENDTIATFAQRAANFARHADNVNSLYQSLNLAYSGVINKETKERIYSDEVIDKMVYAASKIADYDQRIPELSKELLGHGIVIEPLIEDVLSPTPTKEAKAEATKQIEKLGVTNEDELKQSLDDVLEMSARRKFFIDEYKGLKTTPEAFKEAPKETLTPTTEVKKKITLKTKDGDEELEVGTDYYLGRVTEKDKDGNDVYRFPQITILGENEDGTIKIKSSTGVIKDVSKSVLEDYKLGKVSDLKNNKTANYYFNHINDVFQYNFGKASKLGKKRGRLEYNKGKLFFVYKDGNGKVQKKQLFREHFIAQTGFSDSRVKVIGTLQAESAEKKAAREAFLAEQTEEEKKIREEQKQDARIQMVVEAQEETKKRLQEVKEKLEKNKEKLTKVNEELDELLADKKASEARTKKEKLRDEKYPELSGAKAKLAKIFRIVPKAISTLSKIKRDIEYDISVLTIEQEELEFNLSYLEDLGQTISELPKNTVLVIAELQEQKDWIDELIKETGGNINSLAQVAKGIDNTIKELSDLLEDAVKKFNADYPQYLKDGFERMRKSEGVLAEIEVVKQYIADNSFIEDLQKEISTNAEKIEEIQKEIEGLYKQIDQYGKELSAKEAILNRFQGAAEEFRKKEALKKQFEQDKELHDKLFKAQSDISQEPADDSTDEEIAKLQKDADWDDVKKQDLITYPISTAVVVRTNTPGITSTDPEFEEKPHLLREEAFLNNYSNGTLADESGNDISANVKVLVVTKANQESLGLKGLIEQRNPQKQGESEETYNDRMMNAKTGTIIYLYVKQNDDGTFSVIDETGKTTGKFTSEGEQWSIKSIDINKTVTSVARTSTSITEKNLNYTNKSSLDAKAVEAAWEAQRKNLLQGQFQILGIKGISRGIKQITNTSDKNPVIPTLTSQKVANNKPIIHVSTANEINTPNGETIFYRAGRPYLMINNDVVFLNNRNLTKEEANTIVLVMKESAKRFEEGKKNSVLQLDRDLVQWLNSVVYWNAPKEGQKVHNHQIYFKDGKLYISGVDTNVYFTEESIEADKDRLISTFLEGNTAGKGTFHHVSQGALTRDGEYVSYYAAGNELKTKTYPSYQAYLLENQVVTTNVRPQVGPKDANIRGRYAIIDLDLNLPKEEKPPIIPVQKTSENQVLINLKNKINNTKDITSIMDDVFKVLDEKEYEKFQDSFTEAQLQKDLTAEVEKSDKTEVAIANIISKYLLNKFIDKKLSVPTPEVKSSNVPQKGVLDLTGLLAELEGQKTEKPASNDAEALNNIFKSFGVDGLIQPPDNEEEFRRVADKDIKGIIPENWSVVEAWLQKNLPNVPVQRVKHLLEVTGGGWAWGKFGRDGITLYEGAKAGTGYHEAFEAVWKLFTTLEEKQKVLGDVRTRKGTFFDSIYGRQQEYKSATDTQLKELLADEFADFVQKEGKVQEKMKGQSWLIRTFKSLYDFIKGIFNNEKNVSDLFKSINTGYYANIPINTTREAISLSPEAEQKIEELKKERQEKIIDLVNSNLSLTFVPIKQLVDSEIPEEAKRKQDDIKAQLQELNKLIACL